MCEGKIVRNSEDDLSMRYKEFPDEANADAWAIQDACNLQAVARTFMCMARAANFGKDNPAVLCTLDKMNSMSGMQGELFPERAQALHKAYKICHDAYYKREKVREESRCC